MGAALAGQGEGGGPRRRGRRRGRGRAAQPMSEINVTPFVDVMLVLLIIFMVAAPLLSTGVPVALPESETEALPAPSEPPLTVTLAADGRVFVQEAEVPAAALGARLRAVADERSDDAVYLRADGAIAYAQVMALMAELQAAGLRTISLVTEPPAPGAQ